MKNLETGMSLIEIIISMFIVLIVFSLCLMEVNALNIIRKQRHENVAYHIANKEMESLRATTFGNLPSSGTVLDSQLAQIPSGTGAFSVSDYSGYSGIKELIVTISWNDDGSKSIILKTLAGNGGINP